MIYFVPPSLEIRGFDSYGSGAFGAPRSRKKGTRPHLGTDYVVEPGQQITACVFGKLARRCHVYPDTLDWKGLVINADWGGELKIFYMLTDHTLFDHNGNGARVTPDFPVGEAQDIRKRYPKNKAHDAPCTPHIHLQWAVPSTWPRPAHWQAGVDYIKYDGRYYVRGESLAELNG